MAADGDLDPTSSSVPRWRISTWSRSTRSSDGNGRIARSCSRWSWRVKAAVARVQLDRGIPRPHHTADYYAALQPSPRRRLSTRARRRSLGAVLRHRPHRAGPSNGSSRSRGGHTLGRARTACRARGWPDRLVIALDRACSTASTRGLRARPTSPRPPVRTSGGSRRRPRRARRAHTEHEISRHRTAAAPSRRTGRLIADPETGLRAALQLSHLGSSWVVGESPDRAEHPLLDLRVKSFEILVGAPFELDGHGSAVTNRRACA